MPPYFHVPIMSSLIHLKPISKTFVMEDKIIRLVFWGII